MTTRDSSHRPPSDRDVVDSHPTTTDRAPDRPLFIGNPASCLDRIPPGLLEPVDLDELDARYEQAIAEAHQRIDAILGLTKPSPSETCE